MSHRQSQQPECSDTPRARGDEPPYPNRVKQYNDGIPRVRGDEPPIGLNDDISESCIPRVRGDDPEYQQLLKHH